MLSTTKKDWARGNAARGIKVRFVLGRDCPDAFLTVGLLSR